MKDTERALELILSAYQEVEAKRSDFDIDYLEEEAEKDEAAFFAACHVVFGTKLSDVLFTVQEAAQSETQLAYILLKDNLDESDASKAILDAYDVVLGSRVLLRMQNKLKCDRIAESGTLVASTAYYAKAIRKKLDPKGILCPKATKLS